MIRENPNTTSNAGGGSRQMIGSLLILKRKSVLPLSASHCCGSPTVARARCCDAQFGPRVFAQRVGRPRRSAARRRSGSQSGRGLQPRKGCRNAKARVTVIEPRLRRPAGGRSGPRRGPIPRRNFPAASSKLWSRCDPGSGARMPPMNFSGAGRDARPIWHGRLPRRREPTARPARVPRAGRRARAARRWRPVRAAATARPAHRP